LDIHLMIENPLKHVEAFQRAGGNTLVFHMEARSDPEEVVRTVHRLGAAVGAAIRPDTPYERVDPLVERLDQVLVMSVHPGFSGQKFIPEVLPKVRAARARLDALGSAADLSIDGGVGPETAVEAAAAGATFFVCGNSVFHGGDVATNLTRLRASVEVGATLVELIRPLRPPELSHVLYLSQGMLRPEYEGVELGVADSLARRAV